MGKAVGREATDVWRAEARLGGYPPPCSVRQQRQRHSQRPRSRSHGSGRKTQSWLLVYQELSELSTSPGPATQSAQASSLLRLLYILHPATQGAGGRTFTILRLSPSTIYSIRADTAFKPPPENPARRYRPILPYRREKSKQSAGFFGGIRGFSKIIPPKTHYHWGAGKGGIGMMNVEQGSVKEEVPSTFVIPCSSLDIPYSKS